MPRRGGRDRYRTLKQATAATDYTAPRAFESRLPEPLAYALGLRHPRPALIDGQPFLCRHGVPWTKCTICSKPVRT